ncbi:MAG: nitrite/sulfite reductase [Candidatus Sumerlaeaceae bacterium]
MATTVEHLKRQKDGLDVLEDIIRAAAAGFEKMDREYVDLFRWYGLYQQKPKNGYFMLRVKIPNGDLLANQVREVAAIAQEFGRGLVDITTRQNYQLHWIRIENVPEIFHRLQRVGLHTVGACGDVTRNVVGCPIAGIDGTEICDASPLVKRISTYLTGNKEFSNLPRKYKISIAGCRQRCAQPQINDVGLYGIERKVGNRYEFGFGLMVGGGLSTRPYFAADLNVFLSYDQVFDVVREITTIFRDSDVLREDRGKARLKFLIHDPKIGIGAEGFLRLLENKLGYQLERYTAPPPPADTEDDHLGIHPQKQDGLYYVGVGVTSGRTSADRLLRLADIVDQYSTHATLRNTNKQNFIITHIPKDNIPHVVHDLEALGFSPRPSSFRHYMVACTGTEFCNLAITETKALSIELSRKLEEALPNFHRKLRIHISGCPNNCGQTAIADIGLRGGLTKVEGQPVEVYDIQLGGGTGAQPRFAETIMRKVPASALAPTLVRLCKAFEAWAQNGESFRDFVDAHTPEQLIAILGKA